MATEVHNDIVIDAVITWVDGSDEVHVQKMMPYFKGTNNWSNEKFRTRFDQVDEIEFAIKSIVKFAPYISTIFIVTDEQRPAFLDEYIKTRKTDYPKIKIIDHTEIFLESDLLPVFNCRPIETLLYRIPNLSEHFIYFNDDFSLLKKTQPSDFFQNGYPVLRGKWKPLDDFLFYRKVQNGILKMLGKTPKNKKYGYKRGQMNAARALGFRRYLKIDHTPAPMRKSSLENYFKENPEMQTKNIRHRFRNPEQYVLQSLSNHIEIKNDTCVIKNDYQLLYIGGSHKKPLFWYKNIMNKTNQNPNILFLCMQSLDLCPKDKLDILLNWLQNHLKIES